MVGIYKITSPKGKVYIGQSTNIYNRFKHYKNLDCKGQPKLFNSLKKYDPNNHIFEIIEKCSIELLNEREIYWGNKFNVLGDKGLNCKYLGEGGTHTNETKTKISKANKGKTLSQKHINIIKKTNKGNKYKKGTTLSEKHKNTLSKVNKGRQPMLEKKHSSETKKKMSDAVKNRVYTKERLDKMSKSMKGKNTKAIICINTGNIYSSIIEAANELNCNKRSISNILCGLSTQTKHGLKFDYIY